ncbi:MAG TPA: GNAT family N-acetyltransferase, partial [Pengzhenrongella sp.]
LTLPTEDNHHLAFGWLTVLPAARRRGIGSALLAAAHEVTLSQGRTVLTVESQWASGGDDLTGAFLASRGFAPAQTMIRSELPLPAEEARLLAVAGVEDAQGGEGAEYVLETTVDGMPDAWLADRANLQQRMSTDTPLGDLELQEEAWDAARMRDEVDRALAAGRRYVETVARHKGSGRLVGFTTITVSAGAPDLAYQWDTLVLREHRGHGLGVRLKAANTLALQRHAPAVRRARTWNADDNAHMLAVNTALGYLPVGHSREWQKHLGG